MEMIMSTNRYILRIKWGNECDVVSGVWRLVEDSTNEDCSHSFAVPLWYSISHNQAFSFSEAKISLFAVSQGCWFIVSIPLQGTFSFPFYSLGNWTNQPQWSLNQGLIASWFPETPCLFAAWTVLGLLLVIVVKAWRLVSEHTSPLNLPFPNLNPSCPIIISPF